MWARRGLSVRGGDGEAKTLVDVVAFLGYPEVYSKLHIFITYRFQSVHHSTASQLKTMQRKLYIPIPGFLLYDIPLPVIQVVITAKERRRRVS